MKLVIDIPEEYYDLLQRFDEDKCTMDMLILKSATPLEEKKTNTAEWIRQTDKTKKMYGWCFCSNCNAYIGSKPNYCSSCGRKMTNAVAE